MFGISFGEMQLVIQILTLVSIYAFIIIRVGIQFD